jgi:hypothetical protein
VRVTLLHRDGRVIRGYALRGRALEIAITAARDLATLLRAPHVVLRTDEAWEQNEVLYEELDGQVLVDVRHGQADGARLPLTEGDLGEGTDEELRRVLAGDRLYTEDVV